MNKLERPDGIIVCSDELVEIAYSGVVLGNTAPRLETIAGDAERNLSRLRGAVGLGQLALIKAQQMPEFTDLGGLSLDDIESMYLTDGLFTDSSDVVLGVRPADCAVMVYHSANGENALGLIHGGTLGVDGDIHLAALEHMTSHYSVAASDVRITFTPSIHAASYYFPSIRPEQLADERWMKHIDYREDVYHIDILARIVTDLTANGIEPSQLDISPIDTGADPAYFSHARSVRTGELEGRNGVVTKLLPRPQTDQR